MVNYFAGTLEPLKLSPEQNALYGLIILVLLIFACTVIYLIFRNLKHLSPETRRKRIIIYLIVVAVLFLPVISSKASEIISSNHRKVKDKQYKQCIRDNLPDHPEILPNYVGRAVTDKCYHLSP